MPEEFANHINEALSVHGKLSAWERERLSHSEEPWREARLGLAPDEPSQNLVTTESMRKFYSLKLNGQAA